MYACVCVCVCVCVYTAHGLMNRSVSCGAAGFTERGERFVYRRSISMDSSSSGGVSRNGVANKVREARTTRPRPFMKTRANVSHFFFSPLFPETKPKILATNKSHVSRIGDCPDSHRDLYRAETYNMILWLKEKKRKTLANERKFKCRDEILFKNFWTNWFSEF